MFDTEEYNEDVEEKPANAVEKYIRAVLKHKKKTMAESPPFIRKIDHPKFVISEYEPVDESAPAKAVSRDIEEDVEQIHIENAIQANLNAEVLPDAPPRIVRGEIKRVIRVPKRAIQIK